MTTYTTQQITAIGGRESTTRTGEHRVYLNNWADLAGLEINYYGNGRSIRAAAFQGATISNTKASRLTAARVYLDVATGTIRTSIRRIAEEARLDIGDDLVRAVVAGIRAATTTEVTSREAAAQLGVSVRTVQRRAAAGRLPARKGSRGRWIITL